MVNPPLSTPGRCRFVPLPAYPPPLLLLGTAVDVLDGLPAAHVPPLRRGGLGGLPPLSGACGERRVDLVSQSLLLCDREDPCHKLLGFDGKEASFVVELSTVSPVEMY
nr:unnamed protein product [Callosobruchus analis]